MLSKIGFVLRNNKFAESVCFIELSVAFSRAILHNAVRLLSRAQAVHLKKKLVVE